jgi:hypothetical protein
VPVQIHAMDEDLSLPGHDESTATPLTHRVLAFLEDHG